MNWKITVEFDGIYDSKYNSHEEEERKEAEKCFAMAIMETILTAKVYPIVGDWIDVPEGLDTGEITGRMFMPGIRTIQYEIS